MTHGGHMEAGGEADGQVGGAHTLPQDVARNTRIEPGVTRLYLKQTQSKISSLLLR